MSQTQPARYVLDASVAVKWFLDDETFDREAKAVLEAFREDRIALLAPDHIRYEVTNALRTAVRANRVSAEDGMTAVTRFLAWQIPTVGSDALLVNGYDYALRFDCALYDGLYLALADIAQCSLIYADRRLRNSLAGRFPRAMWIADYDAGSS